MFTGKEPGREFDVPTTDGRQEPVEGTGPRRPNAAPSLVDARFTVPEIPRTPMMPPRQHFRQRLIAQGVCAQHEERPQAVHP